MNTTAVATQLDKLLCPVGFTRQKMTWNRKASPFVDVIDLQLSKAGDALTVNAGVIDPSVHKACWGENLPSFVEEPSCTVRTRIGQLVDGKDLWWRDDGENIASEIGERVREHVLPFLDRMHSVEALAEQLKGFGVTKQKYPPPIIYLAVLKWKNGDVAGADMLLSELRMQTVGAWQTRIAEVIARLGLSRSQRPE
jgi:hypothetical protein